MIKNINDLYVFLANWYKGNSISFGLPETEIPEFVPDILRNFYMNIGALTEEMPEIARYSDQNNVPLAQQDCIMSPSELKLDTDGFIAFGWENQGNWTVAVRENSGDDIYLKGDNGENWDRYHKFTKCKSTLTDFLITQTLAETVILSANEWYAYSENQIKLFRTETTDVLWKTSFPPFDMMEVNGGERTYFVSKTGEALRFVNPEWGVRKSEICEPLRPVTVNEPENTVLTKQVRDSSQGFIARLFGRR
jgi:hypothetical protein